MEARTRTLKNTIQPVWEEVVSMSGDLGDMQKSGLELTVMSEVRRMPSPRSAYLGCLGYLGLAYLAC